MNSKHKDCFDPDPSFPLATFEKDLMEVRADTKTTEKGRGQRKAG